VSASFKHWKKAQDPWQQGHNATKSPEICRSHNYTLNKISLLIDTNILVLFSKEIKVKLFLTVPQLCIEMEY
jgi:hypothetical protein